MDFSKWNDYTEAERRGFMMAIEVATQSHVMPPAKYVWVHHQARLSAAELDSLKAWALAEPTPAPRTEAVTAPVQADSRYGRRPLGEDRGLGSRR